MVALPVSGLDVTLRRPAGEEDVLLCEAGRRDMGVTVTLLSRLAVADGAVVRCDELPVTDVEVLLLELRRLMFGDVVHGQAVCPSPDCGARVDVTFRISEYLAHHAPSGSRDADAPDGEGWFALVNAPVRFRLPLASDQIAVAGRPEAEQRMIERCVRPPELPRRLLGRVARVMQSLAPTMADLVHGSCPECGAEIAVYFDPQDFALQELREEASHVYDDVHLLATRYHWSEQEILSMPRTRRLAYTERIREEGRV